MFGLAANRLRDTPVDSEGGKMGIIVYPHRALARQQDASAPGGLEELCREGGGSASSPLNRSRNSDDEHADSERPQSSSWPADQRESGVERRTFLRRSGTALLGLLLSQGTLRAAKVASPERPSTSRASRREAIAAIPFDRLTPALRTRVKAVVDRPTIYRRLPIQVIECHPDLFVFLVRYPEVIVNMWQLMGVTKVEIKRTGPYKYRAKDGAGTISDVQLVYGTRDKHVFLAEGYYDGPLAPHRITGRCVLVLSSAYSKDAKQHSYVSGRLDVFVQLDNAGAEVLAKTLHPFLGRTADSNFRESMRFLSQLSQVCITNGPGVQRLCSRLTAVDPAVRQQFQQLTTRVNQDAVIQQMMSERPAEAASR